MVGLFFVAAKKKKKVNSAAHNNIELNIIPSSKIKV
jgi:hypothetical protein